MHQLNRPTNPMAQHLSCLLLTIPMPQEPPKLTVFPNNSFLCLHINELHLFLSPWASFSSFRLISLSLFVSFFLYYPKSPISNGAVQYCFTVHNSTNDHYISSLNQTKLYACKLSNLLNISYLCS